MKQLKEDVYAMGTMKVAGVRSARILCTFYRLHLEEEMIFSAKYTCQEKEVIHFSTTKRECFGLVWFYYIKWPIALVQKLTVTARFKTYPYSV